MGLALLGCTGSIELREDDNNRGNYSVSSTGTTQFFGAGYPTRGQVGDR